MKIIKKLLLAFLFVFIAIQFYQPRNEQLEPTKDDFLTYTNAPENVATILKNTCYDCHSNKTNYRWYDKIAPASWLVDSHIKEAKSEMNLSEWGSFGKLLKLEENYEMQDKIKKSLMPLPSYAMVHKDAILTEDEKKTLVDWLKSLNP